MVSNGAIVAVIGPFLPLMVLQDALCGAVLSVDGYARNDQHRRREKKCGRSAFQCFDTKSHGFFSSLYVFRFGAGD
jgi:hypothetical protein